MYCPDIDIHELTQELLGSAFPDIIVPVIHVTPEFNEYL